MATLILCKKGTVTLYTVIVVCGYRLIIARERERENTNLCGLLDEFFSYVFRKELDPKLELVRSVFVLPSNVM